MKPYTTEERQYLCNTLLRVLNNDIRTSKRMGKDTASLEADVAAVRRQKEPLNQK